MWQKCVLHVYKYDKAGSYLDFQFVIMVAIYWILTKCQNGWRLYMTKKKKQIINSYQTLGKRNLHAARYQSKTDPWRYYNI